MRAKSGNFSIYAVNMNWPMVLDGLLNKVVTLNGNPVSFQIDLGRKFLIHGVDAYLYSTHNCKYY